MFWRRGFKISLVLLIEELKMKNEIGDINEVIIRFLDGTATCEEKVFLLNWLKQSEKNRNEFSEVRDLWLLFFRNISVCSCGWQPSF